MSDGSHSIRTQFDEIETPMKYLDGKFEYFYHFVIGFGVREKKGKRNVDVCHLHERPRILRTKPEQR